MTLTINQDGYIDLQQFKNLVDISKVVFYSLKEDKGVLILKFYDKNKKLLKTKDEKNGKEKHKKAK